MSTYNKIVFAALGAILAAVASCAKIEKSKVQPNPKALAQLVAQRKKIEKDMANVEAQIKENKKEQNISPPPDKEAEWEVAVARWLQDSIKLDKEISADQNKLALGLRFKWNIDQKVNFRAEMKRLRDTLKDLESRHEAFDTELNPKRMQKSYNGREQLLIYLGQKMNRLEESFKNFQKRQAKIFGE
ncbi:hypothetical protein KY343_03560 [Candidatus Woesearchaeota archaeon]|nr:hypothetical protein [Candidatus Woesearchaeota archaeon]